MESIEDMEKRQAELFEKFCATKEAETNANKELEDASKDFDACSRLIERGVFPQAVDTLDRLIARKRDLWGMWHSLKLACLDIEVDADELKDKIREAKEKAEDLKAQEDYKARYWNERDAKEALIQTLGEILKVAEGFRPVPRQSVSFWPRTDASEELAKIIKLCKGTPPEDSN